MKNNSRRAASALLLTALLGAAARAASYRPAAASSPAGTVPNSINYQGRLVDNGFPVTGLRNVSFRLYDSLTGPTNLLWSSGAQTVAVSQGLFGTTLAISTQALSGATQKFLEVQVDAQVLSPREPLNAVPYALIAKSLEENLSISTVSVGTQLISSGTLAVASIQALTGSGYFSILSPVHMSSATLIIDGNAATALTTVGNVGVGVTGTAPQAQLQVANPSAGPATPDLIVGNGASGSGNNTQVSIYRGSALGGYIGVDAYRSGAGAAPLILNAANGGSVGIGVTSFSPGALLDVDGTAQFGSVGSKSAFSAAGGLTLANNAGLTVSGANVSLSGANGNVVSGASVTASAFFGNGANLTSVPAVSVPASGVTAGTFQNAAYTFQNAVNLTGTSAWTATGRLGVGTVNPAQKIHLSSGTILIDGNVAASIQASGSISAASFSGPISGNATTASALAANGSNCSAGQFPLGVDASGNAESCSTALAGNANTATALAANGSNCSAGQFPLGVDASGNAESCSTSLSGNAATATALASGAANQVPYQTGAGATSFVAAPGANAVLFANGGAPSWTNTPTLTGTNFSSIPNGALSNSAITVNAGSGLSGGGTPSLGGSTTLSLNVGNSNSWTAAQTFGAAITLFSRTKAQLSAVTPLSVGEVYFCSNCTGAVGATGKIVVSTGTSAGNFADAAGGVFQ